MNAVSHVITAAPEVMASVAESMTVVCQTISSVAFVINAVNYVLSYNQSSLLNEGCTYYQSSCRANCRTAYLRIHRTLPGSSNIMLAAPLKNSGNKKAD